MFSVSKCDMLNFNNRIKQYGVLNTLKSIFYYLLKPVLLKRNYEILIIENHRFSIEIDDVKTIDASILNQWLNTNQISSLEYNRFLNFINTDCLGYYIEVENKLAAWGFVQTKGKYKYGEYYFELPQNVQMLKNLYVKPHYRGMSLGKKINEARINGVPDSYIPCGFVIPENRFAIRNLKMHGFEVVLSVTHTKWFNSFTKTRIKTIRQGKCSKMLIGGFQNKTI